MQIESMIEISSNETKNPQQMSDQDSDSQYFNFDIQYNEFPINHNELSLCNTNGVSSL